MGLKSKRSGQRWERAAVKALAPLWPGLRRSSQNGEGRGVAVPDIDGPMVPYWIEVGFTSSLPVLSLALKKFEQAKADSKRSGDGRPPLAIVFRSRGESLVVGSFDRAEYVAVPERDGEQLPWIHVLQRERDVLTATDLYLWAELRIAMKRLGEKLRDLPKADRVDTEDPA